MVWAATAVGAATAIGGAYGAHQSGKAAEKAAAGQLKGAEASAYEQGRQFDTSTQLNLPSVNTGNAARSRLASLLGLSVGGGGQTQIGVDVNGDPVYMENPSSSAATPDSIMQLIEATPGYQFMMKEGVGNTMQNARALGMGQSGEAIKSVSDYAGKSMAGGAYADYANRLANLASGGGATVYILPGKTVSGT